MILAAVTAHASATVSWNTQSVPTPSPVSSAAPAPLQTGIVLGVHGTHVVVRLPDGTTRLFIAPPEQAKVLQKLVGTTIQFRKSP